MEVELGFAPDAALEVSGLEKPEEPEEPESPDDDEPESPWDPAPLTPGIVPTSALVEALAVAEDVLVPVALEEDLEALGSSLGLLPVE